MKRSKRVAIKKASEKDFRFYRSREMSLYIRIYHPYDVHDLYAASYRCSVAGIFIHAQICVP